MAGRPGHILGQPEGAQQVTAGADGQHPDHGRSRQSKGHEGVHRQIDRAIPAGNGEMSCPGSCGLLDQGPRLVR